MTSCDCSGFDQKLGSDVFFSISASWERSLAASKIAPQLAGLVFHGDVFAFEFFDHKEAISSKR
jgi:hypothetical protein